MDIRGQKDRRKERQRTWRYENRKTGGQRDRGTWI